jgi:hypothetical protein
MVLELQNLPGCPARARTPRPVRVSELAKPRPHTGASACNLWAKEEAPASAQMMWQGPGRGGITSQPNVVTFGAALGGVWGDAMRALAPKMALLIGRSMAKRTGSTARQLKFSEPPLRGFLIHLCVYVVVIAGLAAINLTKNPSHPWFLWVLVAWGIALAVHDVIMLIKFPSPSNPN